MGKDSFTPTVLLPHFAMMGATDSTSLRCSCSSCHSPESSSTSAITVAPSQKKFHKRELGSEIDIVENKSFLARVKDSWSPTMRELPALRTPLLLWGLGGTGAWIGKRGVLSAIPECGAAIRSFFSFAKLSPRWSMHFWINASAIVAVIPFSFGRVGVLLPSLLH